MLAKVDARDADAADAGPQRDREVVVPVDQRRCVEEVQGALEERVGPGGHARSVGERRRRGGSRYGSTILRFAAPAGASFAERGWVCQTTSTREPPPTATCTLPPLAAAAARMSAMPLPALPALAGDAVPSSATLSRSWLRVAVSRIVAV